MNLTIDFREQLDSISTWITEQFDRLIAQIKAVWGIQHYPDGTHKAITADSASITGLSNFYDDATFRDRVVIQPTIGQYNADSLNGTASGYAITVRVPATNTLDMVGLLEAKTRGELDFAIFAATTGVRTLIASMQWEAGGVKYYLESAAALAFEWLDDNGASLAKFTASGIFERGRTVAIGVTTTPTFAAGDYTGSGAMTVTVQSTDVTNFTYWRIGDTLFVDITLDTITTGGVAGNVISIKIPAGLTAVAAKQTPCIIFDNSATVFEIGLARVLAAGTTIDVLRPGLANFTVPSTNNTFIRVGISFKVS